MIVRNISKKYIGDWYQCPVTISKDKISKIKIVNGGTSEYRPLIELNGTSTIETLLYKLLKLYKDIQRIIKQMFVYNN